MSWYMNRSDTIICTGPCSTNKVPGFVPCPVDHNAQPLNDVDDRDGSLFYRCDECDWVIPDTDGENKFQTAGMLVCPECENGERTDTYAGPCEEGCNKRNAGAEYRDIPADILAALRRKYGRATFRTNTYACPKCFHKMCKRYRAELAAELRAEEEHLAWRMLQDMYPAGTCGICRNIRHLQVIDHAAEDYVCVDCYPQWSADRTQPEPEATAQLSPAGWYPDPEDPEDYLRWWSGTEWVGPPTLPEHALTQ